MSGQIKPQVGQENKRASNLGCRYSELGEARSDPYQSKIDSDLADGCLNAGNASFRGAHFPEVGRDGIHAGGDGVYLEPAELNWGTGANANVGPIHHLSSPWTPSSPRLQ